MSDGFTTALDELEKTANVHLPALRTVVTEARDLVAGTAEDQDAAFDGDLYAPLADVWEAMRLAMTATQDKLIGRLEDCEAALKDVAARYRDADAASAQDIGGTVD